MSAYENYLNEISVIFQLTKAALNDGCSDPEMLVNESIYEMEYFEDVCFNLLDNGDMLESEYRNIENKVKSYTSILKSLIS